ncbi:hypothetical protein [Streptomyces sp. NPDC002855]
MSRRHGFSHQVPARRAVERAEEKVIGWVAPLVLVRDNLNVLLDARPRACIDSRDRLTCFQLPPYAT